MDSQGMYYLGDPAVLQGVIRDSDLPLRSLDDATRTGQVVQIQNVDHIEDLGGSIVLELLLDEPIPGRLSSYSRPELSNCSLKLPEGRVLFVSASVLNADVLEVESSDSETFLTQLRESGTTIDVIPGVYRVEVFSLHYGLGQRNQLVEGSLSEADLDDWKRREKQRNAGCGFGCLGAFFGLVAAGVLKSLGDEQWAIWLAVAAVLLLSLGAMQFWIVGRNPRYKQLKRQFDEAQAEFPHGIVRLVPAEQGDLEPHPAKCGWVFGD